MTVVLFAGYFVLLLILGVFARLRSRPGHEDFFLARRRLGPLVLLLTLAATNFSSFTVFGFAGAGYRLGYSYYPIMAFGTGFMALTFLLLGIPAHRAAKAQGAITPPELIGLRFENRALHLAYLLVMVVFTLPYLALQPMGAGYMLNALFGLPYAAGAGLVVFVGLGYVLLAGMRGDAWTDFLQGLVMLAGLAVLFGATVKALGGFALVNNDLLANQGELFSRPGGGNFFTPQVWFSYLFLWFVCDPMFPQLFQRFFAARDEKALKMAALFYPLVTGVLFFFPVALGVMAHKVLPGIEGTKTDQILPLLVNKSLPGFFSGVLTVCGIAALMSTMDSQLLTLSSMLVRDIRVLLGKPAEGSKPLHFLVVVILALIGLFLALRPWGTILQIATETFTGLAVLFPVTVAAAYWQKANPWAGFAAIVTGEVLVVLYHFKLLPSFGFLAVVPVVVVVSGILIGGSFLLPARGLKPWVTGGRIKWWQVAPFFVIFVLSLDFYNWHRPRPVVLGLPLWLWFHFLLIGLLFWVMVFVLRAGKKERGSAVGSGAETLFDEHYAPGEGD